MLCQFPVQDLFSQLLVHAIKRYLRLHSFCDVASNFSETDEAPDFIPDGGNDHVSPKPRAVFADAPAFIFESSLASCDLELHFWLARPFVFFGVENREILSDDLQRVVTLDTS